MEDWLIPFLAILVPLAGALVVAVLGRTERAAGHIAALFGGITAGLTALMLTMMSDEGGTTYTWIGVLDAQVEIGFRLDALGVFVAAVAGIIGWLVIIYSMGYMKGTVKQGYDIGRYYALVLLFIGGMIGLAVSDNLLVLYAFWEVIGFCSYALIGYYYRDPKAMPAGTKAFVVTRVGDTGLLVAILALWMATGTFNISEIIGAVRAGLVPDLALTVAGFGVLLGAIGKSAQFPLHVWLPDAMEAPTPISALIHAACLVNAGIYLLARTYPMFSGVESFYGTWVFWVAIVGSATALLTSILALVEADLKKVLAYSTVSQLGYMMAAVGLGSVVAASFHLVSHAIFKALLFLCAGAIIHAAGTRNMYEMGGLRKQMRLTYGAFLAGSLALAGIPPLNGFWSKDLILETAYTHGDAAGSIPLLLLTVTAVITVIYTARMILLVFWGPRRNPQRAHDPDLSMKVPLVVLAFGALFSWATLQMFTGALQDTLRKGYHAEQIGMMEFVREVLLGPFIVLALLCVGILLLLYSRASSGREPFHRTWTRTRKGTLVWFLRKGYMLDDIYLAVVGGVRGLGNKLRLTQSGDLNNNMMGVALAFLVLIAIFFVTGGL